MRTGIYVRISKDRIGQGLGVQRQEDDARELAERLRWDVVDVYVDNDLSATTGVRRPGYERMLDDMRNQRIDGVVAWHVDRLIRQPRELEELITVADENSISFSTVKAGDIDLSTSAGRLVARILGAAAKHEVELKSERQVAQKRQAAHAGKPNAGGARPFGWANDRLTVQPDEAQVIVDAAQMILDGHSLSGVVEWMHDTKVENPSGNVRWYPNVVKRILVNPRLAGIATYKGEIVGQGAWEPILDEKTWRRVTERLEMTRRTDDGTQRRGGGVSLLLSDTIRCGICGYGLSMNTRWQGAERRQRVYACREKYIAGRPGYRKSCGRIVVDAVHLEDDIGERIIAKIIRPSSQEKLEAARSTRDDSAEAVSAIAELERRLKEAGEDYADGLIGRTEFHAARDRLSRRIIDARAKLKVADAPRLPTGSARELAEWWEGASLSQRRTLVDAQIERVTVSEHSRKVSRYDPNRVRVDWR